MKTHIYIHIIDPLEFVSMKNVGYQIRKQMESGFTKIFSFNQKSGSLNTVHVFNRPY